MRHVATATLLFAIASSIGSVSAADGIAARTLTIAGAVAQPTTYSLATLQALPQQAVTSPARTAERGSIAACYCAT